MSERRAASDDEYKEFIGWLGDKRHKDIIEEINTNHLLGIGIKNLLRQNQEIVISKLENINRSLLFLSSKIEDFKEISNAISPNFEISDQSISILKQLEESSGSAFLEVKLMGGSCYQVIDGNGIIKMEEKRFIDNDLNQLVDLGLLRGGNNPQGGRMFYITRAAVKLLQQIN